MHEFAGRLTPFKNECEAMRNKATSETVMCSAPVSLNINIIYLPQKKSSYSLEYVLEEADTCVAVLLKTEVSVGITVNTVEIA